MTISKIISDAISLDKSLKQMLNVAQSTESQALRLGKEKYFREVGFRDGWSQSSIVATERYEAHSEFIPTESQKGITYVNPDDFFNLTTNEQAQLVEDRIFIFTNHFVQEWAENVDIIDRLGRLEELKKKNKRTLFVCWDWDNHHALHVSTSLASLSDIYFYAHDANLYFLKQYCTRITRLPCPSYQFKRNFILNNISRIVESKRQTDFKGVHVYYSIFTNRNVAIKTMSERYPMVRFIDNNRSYHKMSDSQRLDDWLESYFIFIAPTLLDVPCRLFDTLLTGGIPFVPRLFATDEALAGIHDDDIVFYDDLDLLSPENLLIEGRSKLDRWGDTGIIRRVFYAAFNHNFCSRFRTMMTKLELFLQKN